MPGQGDVSIEQRTTEQLQILIKRIQSMLRMLEGNTTPHDIEKLEQAWLDPITDRLKDAQRKIGSQRHEIE